MPGRRPHVFPEDRSSIFRGVDQKHPWTRDVPLAWFILVIDTVCPGDLSVGVAQEHEGQVKPFPDLLVIFGFLIGDGDELDTDATHFPVRMAQLRQVKSSGGSPVATILVHQHRSCSDQAAKSHVVAVFVTELELRGLLSQHRRTILESRWPWKPGADCAHIFLHLARLNTGTCCTICHFTATSGILFSLVTESRRGSLLPPSSTPTPDDALTSWFRQAVPDWPDAVLPDYLGGSIANLAPSILDAFDVPPQIRPSLLPSVRNDILPLDLVRGARVVLLVVIDGLGRLALDQAASNGDVAQLAAPDHSASLTSVFPPTTAAATTSLQYGVAPGTHGMAGYTMYFPEIDQVLNMITWQVAGINSAGIASPDPIGIVRPPNVFRVLERGGIDTVIVSNIWFEESPLTRAQAYGVRYRGYRTLAEFTRRLRREVERPGKRFVFGYWDGFDALGHTWGSDSDVSRLELRLIDQALHAGLLAPLATTSEDVAVIITADHGHIPTPRDARLDLGNVSGLVELLAHRPTGEPRQLGLRFQSSGDLYRDVLCERWPERSAVVDLDAALAAGLYGPKPHHPDLAERLGDILLLARGGTTFSFPDGGSGSLGGHGSLTAAEMLVPLLVWRYARD